MATTAALVYVVEWDYPGFLGDWAGTTRSWLRLRPGKTELTREVQKAGGGGDNRKDKPVSALPPNSTAFYTQIEFAATEVLLETKLRLHQSHIKGPFFFALGKERATSYFRCGFLTFTIFWSPQEQAPVVALLALVCKMTQKLT